MNDDVPPQRDIDEFEAVKLNDVQIWLDGEARTDFPQYYTY